MFGSDQPVLHPLRVVPAAPENLQDLLSPGPAHVTLAPSIDTQKIREKKVAFQHHVIDNPQTMGTILG